MRFTALLVLTMTLVTLTGCERSQESFHARTVSNAEASSAQKVDKSEIPKEIAATESARNGEYAMKKGASNAASQNVSLTQADAATTVAMAAERKIIRNANLTVEVASPIASQRQIVSIAESHQGFVVTSDATQRTTEDKMNPEVTINLVIRVPANQFNPVMEEIRAVGTRVPQEKTTGQDVTEEFIDLDARIKNQKALEVQFLAIMKRAGQVEDALSVQSELANVRTEIEKLEGRRRFLENQASLSTINVSLQAPVKLVAAAVTTGFWYSTKSAFADGVDVASEIVLFLIRAVLALLPILLLIVLPLGVLARFAIRRAKRLRTARLEPEAEAAG